MVPELPKVVQLVREELASVSISVPVTGPTHLKTDWKGEFPSWLRGNEPD